jgi:hypothetical protein
VVPIVVSTATSTDVTGPSRAPSSSARSGPGARAAGTREELVARRRRRIAYSFGAIGFVLVVGTLGLYVLTGSGWVDSFYFECMLATGQGPPFSLNTDSAKLFASFMAFVSIGTVITTLVLNLGPVLGRLWREGIEEAEREFRKIEHEISDEFEGRH